MLELPKSSLVEQFLADLGRYVGATERQGTVYFVVESVDMDLEPAFHYEPPILQEALKTGKAEQRMLEMYTNGKFRGRIEIVALKK